MTDLVEAAKNQSRTIDQKLLEDMLWALSFPNINGSSSNQENSNDLHSHEIMFYYPYLVEYLEKGDQIDRLDVQNSKQFLRIGPQKEHCVEFTRQAQPGRHMSQGSSHKDIIASLKKAQQEMYKVAQLLANGRSSIQETRHETMAYEAMDIMKMLEGKLCPEQQEDTDRDSALAKLNIPSADILVCVPEPAAAFLDIKAPMTTAAGLIFNEDIWGAAKRGDVELLKRIKESNPSLDVTTPHDSNDNSPLYYSSLCGQVEVCHLLLEWIGGPSQVEANELLRCKTNALNGHIKNLLGGSKTIVDIRVEMKSNSANDDESSLLEGFFLFGLEEEEGLL